MACVSCAAVPVVPSTRQATVAQPAGIAAVRRFGDSPQPPLSSPPPVQSLLKQFAGSKPPPRQSVASGDMVFHTLIDDLGVCYLTLTDKAYPKKLAYQYLEELQSEFSRLYGPQIETVSRPYAFIKFGANCGGHWSRVPAGNDCPCRGVPPPRPPGCPGPAGILAGQGR